MGDKDRLGQVFINLISMTSNILLVRRQLKLTCVTLPRRQSFKYGIMASASRVSSVTNFLSASIASSQSQKAITGLEEHHLHSNAKSTSTFSLLYFLSAGWSSGYPGKGRTSVRVRMHVPLHDCHMRLPTWGTEDSLESYTKMVPLQRSMREVEEISHARDQSHGLDSVPIVEDLI